ncbi:MAG: aldo/keto reductase [Clostridia bacterium]|nr:aldo/keto reductase [Clostridia bacterium]
MKMLKLENILDVSPIAIGADHFGTAVDNKTASRILDMYVDYGGNLIDTANVYGKWVVGAGNASEKFLGEWLKSTKKNVVIATKGAHYNFDAPKVMRLKEKDIRLDLEESLRALNKDCIDFYWLHRDDPSMMIGEILDTMEKLRREGKILLYGASNFCADRLFEAERYAKENNITGFSAVSNQHSAATVNPGFNTNPDPTLVIHGEKEEAFHRETKKPLIPYQSTARGYFAKIATGATVSDSLVRAYDNEKTRNTYKKVVALAEKECCSVHAASLIYLARQDYPMLPITSVRSPEQLKDVFEAMDKI